jgi:hypothetical protein
MPCPAVTCRFSAASPCTPLPHPTGGAPFYEASTRVHAIHPSGLPLTCGRPDGTGNPWAFPCAPHPAVTGGARQGGAGREHAPVTTRPTSSALQSASSLARCDLVSQQHERAFGRITGGARKDAGKRHLRGGLPGGGSVPSGPRAWTQGTGIAAQWDGPLLPPAGRGVRACLRCRVGDRCDRHSVSHPRQTWHLLTSDGSRSCHSGTPILQQGGSSARFHLYARVPLPVAHGG